MKIIACDSCYTQSPDKEGLHAANHWTKIILNRVIDNNFREYVLCLDCLPNNELPTGKRLLHALRNLFKIKNEDQP